MTSRTVWTMAALLVVVAAGSAISSSPARATSTRAATDRADKFQVVLRGESRGPWRAWLFGADCAGPVEVEKGERESDPVVVTCRAAQAAGGIVDPDETDGRDGDPSLVSLRRQRQEREQRRQRGQRGEQEQRRLTER